MTILGGLGIALLGAAAIACGVFGLSHLYVGQWSIGGGLVLAGLLLGVLFNLGWERFLVSLDGPPQAQEAADTALLPAAPALLSSFWLTLLAVVLLVGGWLAEGASRWLSVSTALCLVLVAAVIYIRRPRPVR